MTYKLTVSIRYTSTKKGDSQAALSLEQARERVEQIKAQGWLVTKTYSEGGALKTVQVQKASEIQDGDNLLATPSVAGG